MRSRSSFRPLLIGLTLVAVGLAGACAGSGDAVDGPGTRGPGDTTTTPPSGLPTTDEQAVALVDSIASRIGTLQQSAGYASPDAIASLLRATAGVRGVQITSDGNVVAIFPRGIPVTFFNNAPRIGTAPTPVPVRASARASARASEPRRGVHQVSAVPPIASSVDASASMLVGTDVAITAPRNVRVLDGRGTALSVGDVDYGALFTQAGFRNVTTGPSTIDALATVNGDDVLMILGHGGIALQDTLGILPTLGFGVWTATRFTSANLALYNSRWRSGQLGVGCAPHNFNATTGVTTNECHFIMLPEFVRRSNWRLHGGAMVILNICEGASAPAADLHTALYRAGAASIMGWTDLTFTPFASHAVPQAIDFMSGANFYAHVTAAPFRPFTWSNTKRYLDSIGLAKFNVASMGTPAVPVRGTFGDTSRLVLLFDSLKTNNNAIFHPSLLPISVDAARGELSLGGTFASPAALTSRTVRVGSRAASILSWSSTNVVVDLQPGDEGSVVVVTTDTTGSTDSTNARMLSKWEGSISYTRTQYGVLQDVVSTTSRFRADIGDYWSGPHGTLLRNFSATRNGVPGIVPLSDSGSTCGVGTSGVYDGSPALYRETWLLTGAPSLPITTSTARGCVATLFLPATPGSGGGQLGVFARSGNVKTVIVTTDDGLGNPQTTTRTDQIIFAMSDVLGGSGVAGAAIGVSPQFAVTAGTLPRTTLDGLTTYRFTWGAMNATTHASTTVKR